MTTQDYVNKLNLLPHPEGGYFKETYRSEEVISTEALPERFAGERAFGTSIYYLLEGNDFSAFHRLKSDEIWHFYDGSPISLHLIYPSGEYRNILLGTDLFNGEEPQIIIPKGIWFAAHPVNKSSFSLVGCAVYPGFDFSDFEMASFEKLSELFPQHSKLLKEFTRG